MEDGELDFSLKGTEGNGRRVAFRDIMDVAQYPGVDSFFAYLPCASEISRSPRFSFRFDIHWTWSFQAWSAVD